MAWVAVNAGCVFVGALLVTCVEVRYELNLTYMCTFKINFIMLPFLLWSLELRNKLLAE